MRPWEEFTGEEILLLPIDDLALRILRDMVHSGEWNSDNWLGQVRQSGEQSIPSARAFSEGVDWLRMHGLLAKDPTQSAAGAIFVTRLGSIVADRGLDEVRAAERIQVDMHPKIESNARSQFLMGNYELAAFDAMKQVEIRVRTLGGFSDSDLGVTMMRTAFKSGGPLSDPTMHPGEQVARMELFAGAVGLFKNPSSHREVEFDDATEASEVVLLADLLMRILDRIEDDLSSP